MIELFISVYVIIIGAAVVNLLAMYRNSLVYRVRTRAACENLGVYRRLPSYDKMMWQLNKWTYGQFVEATIEDN